MNELVSTPRSMFLKATLVDLYVCAVIFEGGFEVKPKVLAKNNAIFEVLERRDLVNEEDDEFERRSVAFYVARREKGERGRGKKRDCSLKAGFNESEFPSKLEHFWVELDLNSNTFSLI